DERSVRRFLVMHDGPAKGQRFRPRKGWFAGFRTAVDFSFQRVEAPQQVLGRRQSGSQRTQVLFPHDAPPVVHHTPAVCGAATPCAIACCAAVTPAPTSTGHPSSSSTSSSAAIAPSTSK